MKNTRKLQLVTAALTAMAVSAPVVIGATAEANTTRSERVASVPRDLTTADVQDLVIEQALAQGVPVELALAVARVESGFQPKAVSHKGARGVMQIMPATAKGEFDVEADALWDAELNVQLGVRYLKRLHALYEGSWTNALSHYNGGTLKGVGSAATPHSYTRSYVTAVTATQEAYEVDTAMQARISQVTQLQSGSLLAGAEQEIRLGREEAQSAALIDRETPNYALDVNELDVSVAAEAAEVEIALAEYRFDDEQIIARSRESVGYVAPPVTSEREVRTPAQTEFPSYSGNSSEWRKEGGGMSPSELYALRVQRLADRFERSLQMREEVGGVEVVRTTGRRVR